MEEEYENGEELLKRKQKERKERKGQKTQSLVKGFLKFITGALILFVAGYGFKLNGWYLKSYNNVTVVNNRIVKTVKIKKEIKDIPLSRLPIFMTSMNGIKKQIQSLPPVQDVYIRRFIFPARIVIFIREKIPVITIKNDYEKEPVGVFTKDGSLIKGKDYLPLPKEYKTILVLSGSDYKKWNLKEINEIKKMTNYIETFSREDVKYIDMRNSKDVYVKLETITLRLGLLDDKVYERIERLPSIMPELRKVQHKVKYVDLSWDNAAYLKLDKGNKNENNFSPNKI